MATESELNQHYDRAIDTIARAYHAATRDGSVPGIGREAVKDVRNTIHEFFFGKSERGGEPGAPLNPLFHDIVEARKSHEDGHDSGPQALGPPSGPLPSPSDIAEDRVTASPQQDRGNVHGQETAKASSQEVTSRGNATVSQLATPGEIANDKGQDGPLGQGIEIAQRVPPTPGGFTEREIEREKARQGGNADQNELAKARILPDEQRQQDRSQGR